MEWIFVFPFILIGIRGLVLWIWALVDAIKVPDESLSGNRIIWVLVIILTGFIGAIIYLVVGRPSDADRAGRPPATPPMPPPPPGALG
jgi:phospholipase D-like protein